ncbi:hypothetical protein KJ657_03140 [Patescibacteria group bacterium]|nr:hypothetical protein [Patescibacteria group bacterium]MBU1016059.1 hypothetical protein [Patescibacteria group bacterium]MBU1938677.1 hypothetical protein [Patescibacteria group bacterium]
MAKSADTKPSPEAEVKAETTEPPGSSYEELVENSPFSPHTEGGSQQSKSVHGSYICMASGRFNLGPTPDTILMHTYCVDLKRNHHVSLEDTIVHRTKKDGFDFYQVPFKRAWVSVAEEAGQKSVYLHYRDTDRVDHNVLLHEQHGKEYAYSFNKLVPQPVDPYSHHRTM